MNEHYHHYCGQDLEGEFDVNGHYYHYCTRFALELRDAKAI